MTQCCHCVGSPPPPPLGACCFECETPRSCVDNISEGDCLSKPCGVFYPNQTCGQVNCDLTCFTEDSIVHTTNGPKKISDVQVGEKVRTTWDNWNTVLHIEKTKLGSRRLVSINGSDFFFTDDHPIWTSRGFKSCDFESSRLRYSHVEFVGNLSVGDIIHTPKGAIEVESIEFKSQDKDTDLFDLGLDGNNLYYVNDFLFHNCSYARICCQRITPVDGVFGGFRYVEDGWPFTPHNLNGETACCHPCTDGNRDFIHKEFGICISSLDCQGQTETDPLTGKEYQYLPRSAAVA